MENNKRHKNNRKTLECISGLILIENSTSIHGHIAFNTSVYTICLGIIDLVSRYFEYVFRHVSQLHMSIKYIKIKGADELYNGFTW